MEPLFRKHQASFRDPSGFVFTYHNTIYRQVNQYYEKDFELLLNSGLYQKLAADEVLVSHQQINENLTGLPNWYTTLLPEQLSFISYPFEWCFNMLKDAALITLDAARQALDYGMILKDATAYNVQWHKGKMMLIDSLSFEQYDGKSPWIAYRQFCEHFLAPLAFMHYTKQAVHPILSQNTEGFSLKLAKAFLPVTSKFNLHMYLHLHLHASFSEEKTNNKKKVSFSIKKFHQILSSLKTAIQDCSFSEKKSTWSAYYEEAAERENYLEVKKTIIDGWVKKMNIGSAVDVGSNEGEFSILLANQNIDTTSIDSDHIAINKLYNKCRQKNIRLIHPLVIDIAHPSPSIGWMNEERSSFLKRTKTDLVLALAVIHHLAIGKNVPLQNISTLFSSLGKYLITEFVPKEDEKVQLMLAQKKDIYDWYTEENFCASFALHFTIINQQVISSSGRTLYLMSRNAE